MLLVLLYSGGVSGGITGVLVVSSITSCRVDTSSYTCATSSTHALLMVRHTLAVGHSLSLCKQGSPTIHRTIPVDNLKYNVKLNRLYPAEDLNWLENINTNSEFHEYFLK